MPNKRDVDNLNRISEAAFRAKLGDKLDQLMAMLALQNGGAGVWLGTTLSNSTTALAFTAFTYFAATGVPIRQAAGTKALTATTHDVAIDKWASYRVSIQADGTITITKSADKDTESDAVAALPAIPANEANMGYFVVRGGTAAIFDATTNNLATGAVTGMIVKFSPAPSAIPVTSPQLQ